MTIAFLLILAYLIGSIPTAVWVSKWVYGIDIREHGSGNAGATNAFRILGKKAGSGVMLVDMMKGFLAVKLAFFSTFIHTPPSEPFVNLQIFLGLAAVVGHIFPIWADFRGGKGIATLFGMILSIQWIVAVSLVLVFMLMLLLIHHKNISRLLSGNENKVPFFRKRRMRDDD